jgi:hypothetical protein
MSRTAPYLREELTIRAHGECSDVVLDQLRQAMIASADPPETWSGELMIRTHERRLPTPLEVCFLSHATPIR